MGKSQTMACHLKMLSNIFGKREKKMTVTPIDMNCQVREYRG